jgi:predicted transposase YbfD/YdcC
LHQQAFTIAQVKIDSKTDEIPSVAILLEPLEINNQVVTFDALHTEKPQNT